MYYRFQAIPETESDPMFSKVRRILQIRMLELGLKIDRKHIESLMNQKNLKAGEIQFWFTQKGYNQVGKHLAHGEMFLWYKTPKISPNLIIYKDELQIASKQLIIGKKQLWSKHSSL